LNAPVGADTLTGAFFFCAPPPFYGRACRSCRFDGASFFVSTRKDFQMPSTMSELSVLERNRAVLDCLDEQGVSTEMRKQAADTVNEYTRLKMREDGFLRSILPPIQISWDEIDRLPGTDKPYKIVDIEVDNAMAMSIPFGTFAPEIYIQGNRYCVPFDRITTHRYTKDVAELGTYKMDIRQVLSDNAIKDMLVEEDGKFIMAVNSLVGTMGVMNPYTGGIQYVQISGGITRDTFSRALKVLPSTALRLPVSKILVNNLTISDVQGWGRDEVGGDLAQEILQNGFTESKLFGKDILVTIKNELIPDNSLYEFASPDKLGKFYTIDDITMYVKKDAYMFSFFAYSLSGAAIGNAGGVARVDFVA
jgi:hypothetical protein